MDDTREAIAHVCVLIDRHVKNTSEVISALQKRIEQLENEVDRINDKVYPAIEKRGDEYVTIRRPKRNP